MVKRIRIGQLIEQGKAHSQTGPFGTQLSAAEYVEEGVPVINVRNIGFGDVRPTDLEFVNEEKAYELRSHRLQNNDIVFGRKGAVERHSLITEKEHGWIQGSDCIRLRFLTDEFDPTFISFFFRTESHKQWMINLGSFGATMTSLNQEIISKIEIPDISLPIQQKIASILSAYDELIENNKQRIKLLEEMAEEIYKEWFVRFRFPGYEFTKFFDEKGKEVQHGTVGALPEGWMRDLLSNQIKIFRGKSYSSEELREESGLPMLNLKNVARGGGFRRDGLKYFEGKYSKSNLAYPDDIMLAVTDMTQNREIVGRVARVPNMNHHEFIFSMDLVKIVPNSLPKSFVYSLFKYSGIGYYLAEFANGVNVLHLVPDLIYRQRVVIPANDLVKKYEKLVIDIFQEIDILENKTDLLQQTRDLLLPRLISGKLSVEHLIDQEPTSLPLAAEPAIAYGKN